MSYDWPDYTGRDGAKQLAEQIKWYWAQRGGSVDARARPVFGTQERNCWAVESDLIGGWPKNWVNS